MVLRVLVLFISLTFISCEGESVKNPDGSYNGKLLYEKNCKMCHGPKGDLGASNAKNLRTSNLSEKKKFNIIKYGQGDMQKFDYLKDEEIEAIVEYIETLKD